MGVYAPRRIVRGARWGRARADGGGVLPVNVMHSDLDNTLGDPLSCRSALGRAWTFQVKPGRAQVRSYKDQPAIRLGLREIRGLSEDTANAIVAARRQKPFRNIADLCLRANLDENARRALPEAGALRRLARPRNNHRWHIPGNPIGRDPGRGQ